ncbi:MBL fold metallo-hydrolase [bacterium]|nr:MBL fold metallo-hydrolase [bacterium]
MIVQQIKLRMMDVFCYLVGDKLSKTCALIDPAFEVDKILSVVQEKGFRVSFIINTHGHADHTAGNAKIIRKTGARLLIHEKDADGLMMLRNRLFARLLGGQGSPKPEVLLKDGYIINIGDVSLKVIHTPGHSPGSICLLGDGNLFTGDTLFVGAVGRTDLTGGSRKRLLTSIHDRLYTLPDETIVWPGHDYGESEKSTIFKERTTNLYTN